MFPASPGISAIASDLSAYSSRPAPRLPVIFTHEMCDPDANVKGRDIYDRESSGDEMTIGTTDCTLAQDTDHAWAGRAGLKMTCSAGAISHKAQIYYDTAADLTGAKGLIVPFWIHEGAGDSAPENVSAISVWAYDGSLVESLVGVFDAAQAGGQTDGGGWRVFAASLSDGIDPLFDWTNVIYVRVQVTSASSAATPSVTFGGLQITDRLTEDQIPVLLLRVDDEPSPAGTESIQAIRVANKHGVPMTIAAIGQYINASAANVRTLQQLQRAGNCIANHLWGSGDVWSTMSVSEQVASLTRTKKLMIRNGLGRGSGIVITPGGAHRVPTDAQEILGRHADALWFTSMAGILRGGTVFMDHNLRMHTSSGANSIADLDSAVTDLLAVGDGVMSWTFHRETWETAGAMDDWETLMIRLEQQVAAGNLRVVAGDWLLSG